MVLRQGDAPDNLYVLSNLGVVRFRAGKLDLAADALRRAVTVAPTDDFSHRTLGVVYYSQGKYDEAINSLTKAIALNLGELSYMDSAGLGELISSHSTATRAGARIKLFGLTKRVSDLLAITKVLTVFDVHDTEQAALGAFK